MVRSRWIKAVMATVVSTGLVWGQSPVPSSSQAPDDPTGRIITVNEAGKPPQKCRVVKVSVDEKGRKVLQVEALSNGEMMTIITEGAPFMGEAPGSSWPKTMRTQIFHWGRDHTPLAAVCDAGCSPSEHVVASGPGIPVITTAPPGSCPVCTTCPPSSGPAVTASTGSWGAPCDTCKPGSGPTIISGNWGSPSPSGGSAPGDTKVVTTTPMPTDTPPKPKETKVTQAEPSLLEKWRESWGKSDKPKLPAADTTKTTEPKKPAPDTAKAPEPPKKPAAETKDTAKVLPPPVLPHADTNKPDPLLSDPTKYSRRPIDEKLPAKGEVPPTDLSKLPGAGGAPSLPAAGGAPSLQGAGEPLGAGARSITDSGAVQSAPYPVATFPPMNMGPPPRPPMPAWQVPQAPQPINPGRGNPPEANQGGIAYNAFTPTEFTPPAPGTPEQGMLGNAFSSDLDPRPATGVFGPSGPHPTMMPPPGYGPMNAMLPPAPYGPVVRMSNSPNPMGQGTQVAMLPPQRGNGVVQAGYQAPAAPAAPAAGMGSQQLTGMLRDALYPSQREWAAEKLSVLDWKQNDAAVQALARGVREDPAPTVRAACIRALAKMKADSYAVVSAVQAAKKDADARVRNEADEALGVVAPGATAPAPLSPAVQPTAVVPPPAPPPPPVPAPAPAPAGSPALPPLSN